MKKIEFSKYNAQGNDFVIIDSLSRSIKLSEDEVKTICDRHFGVGADGLILVKKTGNADFYMDFYNMDGSKAEMCGNGIRCMTGFIFEKDLSDKSNLKIGTLAGIRSVKMEIKNKILENIKVNMGKPIFNPKQIPVEFDKEEVFNHKLCVGNWIFGINCISMGNPHCVIYINESEELDNIPLDVWGPAIEKNGFFLNKTNVEFVKPVDANRVEMRVWERGVGETFACGTGACAVGVCTIKLGKIKGSVVNVRALGGDLKVLWESPSGNVSLEGKVQHVFDGVYFM